MSILRVFLAAVVAVSVELASAACGLSIDNSPRAPGQEPITAEVLQHLVGTWGEDPVEFVNLLSRLGLLPADQVERALKDAKEEERLNPTRPWITVRADGTFTWPRGTTTAKLVVREWVIDVPEGDYCAQIYAIKGQFYRGSREFRFVPLKRVSPRRK
jgi:hypothetical protein